MLETRNVSVFYGRHRALENVSATVSQGEIVVMLGAAYTHLASAQGSQVIRPVVFLCLLAVVGWQRRGQAMR